MRKLPLICALVLLCAASTLAQIPNRPRLDNFDLPQGVRIESIPTTGALPSKSKNPAKKKVRLTASSATPLESGRAKASGIEAGQSREVHMKVSKSLDGFSTGNPQVDELIVESGTRNGVDPVLLYSIMHRESAFKQRAISHKGARGLMQLMPGTAARFGVTNIFDPRQNIEAGARYMRFLLNFFDGNVPLALAGYNAGEGAVLKYGRRIPPYRETQEYVRRITERYALMRDPETARRAKRLMPAQVVQVAEEQTPAPVYEREVFAVRMPDGKLRLVSQ